MYNLLAITWKNLCNRAQTHARHPQRRSRYASLQVRALEPRWTPSSPGISHVYNVSDGASLMTAVQTADTQSGTSEIVLTTAGTYSITATLDIHVNLIITSANLNNPQSYVIAPESNLTLRLISITGSNSVTVEGVTLQGGSATGDGGAINATATGVGLSLFQTIVQNNTATGNGGALAMADSAALNMVRTTFVNNSAGGSGGAVDFQARSQAATVVVDHTTFRTNVAGSGGSTTRDGGGMFVQAAVPSGAPAGTLPPAISLTLTYTNFYNNSATRDGGGLWANDVARVAAGTITATGNTSVQDAGGLGSSVTSLNSASFALANSTISGNQVTGPGVSTTPDGGGVCFDFKTTNASGTVTAYVANNTISNNSVLGAGGGMFLRDLTSGTTFAATLLLNHFSSNAATFTALGTDGGEGGGLYLDASGTTNAVSSVRDIFSGNSADINGGGIYLTSTGRASALASFNADSFTGNRAGSNNATTGPDTNEGDGGGLMAQAIVPGGSPAGTLPPALRLVVVFTSFTNNSATNEGGGLWASDVTGLAAGTLTVTGNTSVQDAGGLGSSVSDLNYAAFALANSTISGNQVTGPGAGVTPDAGGVCFDFTTTNASGTVTAYVANNTISNNTVLGAGGGMFLRDQASHTSFAATLLLNHFSGNSATYSALGTDGGEGGGLYLEGSGATNTMTSVQDTFNGNTADINGGGLYLASIGRGTALASFNADSFTSNRAGSENATTGPDTNQGDGGGLMAQALPPIGSAPGTPAATLRVIVTNTNFQSNTATNEGGGLWASDVIGLAAGSLTVTGNTSVQDAGGLGSSVSTLNYAAFALANSTFSGNQVTGSGVGATPDGGGVCFDFTTANASGTVTAYVVNNSFSNNSVTGAGGGMFLRDEATGTTFRATVFANSASGNAANGTGLGSDVGQGGSFYVRASGLSNALVFSSNTLSNNTAATDGGGLAFRLDSGTATVNDNNGSGNQANDNGGGLFLTGNTNASTGGTFDLTGDTLSNNQASTDGGGLYIDANVLAHVISNAITYNTAGTAGGGIFNNGTLTLKDSTLTHNSAPTGPNIQGPYTDEGGNTIG